MRHIAAHVIALCMTLSLTPQHVARVIDGDTFVLFNIGVPPYERIRILHVDAPEANQPGFTAGKDFAVRWLAEGQFILSTCSRDGFGRLLATVTRDPGRDLAQEMIAAGHGTSDRRK